MSQDRTGASEPVETPLPGEVRDRVVGLAADALGVLAPADVPARLQAIARFAPRQRARRGAAALSAVLDTDPAFLARVAELGRSRSPELAASLEAGRVPPTADLVDAAALAYLLRTPGWPERVAAAAAEAEARSAAVLGSSTEIQRLREQLDAVRAQGRTALEAQRAETAAAQAEARALRKTVADARRAAAAAEEARQEALRAAEVASADAARRVTAAESESRRLRDRVAEVERALDTARRAARSGRSAEDVRLRLLLDTVVESAAGLRRELALPPVPPGRRPADLVTEAVGESDSGAEGVGPVGPRARALRADDPAVVDGLLALPQVHLLVDGYNVTKTGYGTLPLDVQRERLVTGLAALAARTGAEVTCVFDGAALERSVPVSRRRGVRVTFSPPGVTADEVIRELARAEPPGRPVVVVSSDREVVDGVVAAGAHAVTSAALLGRLDRG